MRWMGMVRIALVAYDIGLDLPSILAMNVYSVGQTPV